MSRVGKSRRMGMRTRRRTIQGTRVHPSDASTFASKLFCITDCMR